METKKMILSSNGVKKILSNMGYSFKVELYMQNIIVSIWKDKYLFQKQYEYNVILEEIKGSKLISDFKVQLVKNHAFKKAFTYFMEEKNISLETQIPNSNIPLRITPEYTRNTMKTETEYRVGKSYMTHELRSIKIMAFADNYYMCRYVGAVPFVIRKKELNELIKKQ